MAVPEEIRQVPRPVNTTVYDAKREGPRRYFVRERIGCKYVKGRCTQPVFGEVIGYIHEGKFIPRVKKRKNEESETLSMAYSSSLDSWA